MMRAKHIASLIIFAPIVIYVGIYFYLPKERTPAINMDGATMKQIFQEYDGQFVSFYLEKQLTKTEKDSFINNYTDINRRYNRRKLTELIGFDKTIKDIGKVECLIIVDCKSGYYYSMTESYMNDKGDTIHYISSDDKVRNWEYIQNGSIIDNIAISLCDRSRY